MPESQVKSSGSFSTVSTMVNLSQGPGTGTSYLVFLPIGIDLRELGIFEEVRGIFKSSWDCRQYLRS